MIEKFNLPPLVTCKFKRFQTHNLCLSREEEEEEEDFIY